MPGTSRPSGARHQTGPGCQAPEERQVPGTARARSAPSANPVQRDTLYRDVKVWD